jgi:hypothetical protein
MSSDNKKTMLLWELGSSVTGSSVTM